MVYDFPIVSQIRFFIQLKTILSVDFFEREFLDTKLKHILFLKLMPILLKKTQPYYYIKILP